MNFEDHIINIVESAGGVATHDEIAAALRAHGMSVDRRLLSMAESGLLVRRLVPEGKGAMVQYRLPSSIWPDDNFAAVPVQVPGTNEDVSNG